MKLYKVLILIFFVLTSCKNESNKKALRNCECQLEDFPSEIIDSSQTAHQSDIGADVSVKIKPEKIREIIDIEIKGGVNYNNTESRTNFIVKKINNSFPQYSNLILYNRFSKQIFCSIYTSKCQDSTISDKELREFKEKELFKLQNDYRNILIGGKIGNSSIHPIKTLPNNLPYSKSQPFEKEVFIRLNISTKGLKKVTVNGKNAKIVMSTDFIAKLLITPDEDKLQEIVVYCNNDDSCKFSQIINRISTQIDNTFICKN